MCIDGTRQFSQPPVHGKSGPSFACACNALWSLRTCSGASRLAPVSTCPFLLPALLSNRGPFPPPELPGFRGTTGLSATLTGPACPSRESGLARARHRQGFPCCLCLPLTQMLSPIPRRRRPVRSSLASRTLAAFPESTAGRPPHQPFRGLLSVSLALRPVCLLSHPKGGPVRQSASAHVVTSMTRSDGFRLERQLAGRDSHPLGASALARRTLNSCLFCRKSGLLSRIKLPSKVMEARIM